MRKACLLLVLLLTTTTLAMTQETDSEQLFSEKAFSGLKLRSIGPALMSGRIADIAIHPQDNSTWYIAVGSGGVWKTENAGTTWTPIFDDQPVYSIGCVTIDPSNPNTIWVGTGENVGGRHVGYGDGIYKSTDGGASWKNMGLTLSGHISEIIVHPDNSNIIWAASQGPLWNSGGDRGVYKSTDGGRTWNNILSVNKWTGATDMAIDSRNPDILYAATWQRHRTVAAYMGGGEGSGIYRTDDGGETWTQLKKGLPDSEMGKIGIALSPQNNDVIYAAIELDRRTGAVYRSTTRGESWEKRSETVSGGTGPHYYQELYASPHKEGLIYLADVRMQVSHDGGKTFARMKEKNKHSDNHALAFRKDDPDYLLVGTDGGLYESFDHAGNWRYIANLPLTQFYKVAVDDAEPFYNVYGGTQDNNTQGGPSRTDNVHGIRNADWFITVFADGHQPATEPGNPDIVYSEWQQGNLVRTDRTTGEVVYIQPQPGTGEKHERFNWDAPILVSAFDPARIYFASHRVWQSDNRGDSWMPISEDLTRDEEQVQLPIMGTTKGWDAAWDLYAMSDYNTITSLSESPVQEGILYAGTDDGLIQVTTDHGKTWRKIEVGNLPGVPETAFVNDIKADLYDANTVYVALDNHKFGDFKPYLLKSTDLGKTWKSIAGNIPDRTLIWRMVQDHKQPDLIFAATEFGIYFTVDGGQIWTKLSGNVPTISFRDLAIQKRENDLVGASFGRGFYIFDDYSILREVNKKTLEQEAALFSTRDAWWYIPRPVLSFSESPGSQGAAYYVAPNPPFGAVFTYYLKEGFKTREEQRQEGEKKMKEAGRAVNVPDWETLEEEITSPEPVIWLIVRDSEGNVIRRIPGPVKKGFHRVAWNLRYPANKAIGINEKIPVEPAHGFLAPPGTYSVTLSKEIEGKVTELGGPVEFEVKPLRKGALKGSTPDETAAFWEEISALQREISVVYLSLENQLKKVKALEYALNQARLAPGETDSLLYTIRKELLALEAEIKGPKAKNEIGVRYPPTVMDRLNVAVTGTSYATYGPTPMHRESLALAGNELIKIKNRLSQIIEKKIPELENKLKAVNAPYVK